MERILTLKEQIGKFFFAKHLDFLTSVPQRRIQEIPKTKPVSKANKIKLSAEVADLMG